MLDLTQRLLQNPVLENPLRQSPITLVDIGARGGIHERWEKLRSNLRVIAFEPDSQECMRLNKQGNNSAATETYIPTALSNRSGQAQLNITRSPGCSSLLEPRLEWLQRFPESERFDIQKKVQVPLERLDDVLEARACRPDFIKLDVQGTELDILEGAEKVLGTTFGIEVEVEFSELYKGQALFADIDPFLRRHGFMLFGLKRQWWKRQRTEAALNPRGQIIFADALYFKDYKGSPERPIQAIAICMAYEKFDYAIEIALRSRETGALKPDEADAILSLLRSSQPALHWLPYARGRYWLSKWLEKAVQHVAPSGWAASDRWL